MALTPQLWSQKKKMLMFLDPVLQLHETRDTLTTHTKATTQISVLQGNHLGNANPNSGRDLITSCEQGQVKEALSMMHLMEYPEDSIYASLLQVLINIRALPEGKLVHAHMIQTGFKPDIFLDTKIVIMYAKCGSLVDARRVLDEMPYRNVVSWTVIIGAYARHGSGEEALKLFYQMQRTGIQPNHFTFTSVLPACANLAALKHGKEVHEVIIRSGFQSNVFVGSALVDMYVKCHSLENARQLFDKMAERNAVSWNAMIAGYVQNGHVDEALKLFQKMPERTVVSWTAMIAGYVQNGQVDEALKFFQEMPERNVVSWTAMVSGYAQNGNVDEALKLFQQMPERDAVAWNAMIAGYAQNGHVGQALTLFYQMKRTGIEPNQFTVATVLPACANIGALKQGKEIHEEIIRSGIQSNVFVENALVDMYAKCRSLDNARHMFDKMPKRDVISWNTMIAGYVQNGYMKEAFELFQKMPEPNVVSWTAMIAGYAQIGYVDEALKLFQKIVEPDVVSWNAMVGGYVQNGYVEEALNHFQQMKLAGMKPNSKTFAALLPACADLAVLEMGKEVHEDIIRSGLQSDVFVGSALVDMYTKCGSIENARIVFDKLPHRDVVSWNTIVAGYAHSGNVNEALELFNKMPQRDVVSWNAMIAGYIQNGHVEEALKLFQKMPVRDVVSWNAIITGYTQSGDVEEALKLFQKMPKRDVVSWNVMIAGYAQNGHSEEALKLFREMQLADMKPNLETFTIILLACANLAVMEHGKEAHEIVIRSGFQSDVFVGNTLVGMYAKSGSLEDAGRVFDKMPQRDVISWTTMIVGYAIHGCGKEALELFEHMQHSGTNPNHVTFVGVLSACCHAGLVDEGWQYFDRMSEYRIIPAMEHYGCMVDLLGRAGQLEKALDFINKMPIKPDAALWGSLLGACSTHGNIDLGEHVAELLFELNPEDSATYVLLSNMYAAAGRWVDIQKVRKMMKDRRVKKKPGCSWIEVNKQVYAFLVGER